MNNIKNLRKRARLTQAELAKMIGVHQTAVSQWERGFHEMTRRHERMVAKALGCTTNDLYEEDKHDDGAFGILQDERPEIRRTYQTQSYLRMLRRRGRSAEL